MEILALGHEVPEAPFAGETVARLPVRAPRIERMIGAEVIPRLVLSHRQTLGRRSPGDVEGRPPALAEVAELASLVRADDPLAAGRYVDSLRGRGVTAEAIFLDLLAPAACRLGELWESDDCNFTDVTVGVVRLQGIMRDLVPAFHGDAGEPRPDRRILLMPAVGEQHTFGLAMVGEFFRRAGWEVTIADAMRPRDLGSRAASDIFSIVGFSAGSERGVDGLAAAIRAVRRSSRNPAVGIVVGGPAFAGKPELATLVGADAYASDGHEATRKAESLLQVFQR